MLHRWQTQLWVWATFSTLLKILLLWIIVTSFVFSHTLLKQFFCCWRIWMKKRFKLCTQLLRTCSRPTQQTQKHSKTPCRHRTLLISNNDFTACTQDQNTSSLLLVGIRHWIIISRVNSSPVNWKNCTCILVFLGSHYVYNMLITKLIHGWLQTHQILNL